VSSSGVPAARIAEGDIAAAYLPLRKRTNLGIDRDKGAAGVTARGIAVPTAQTRIRGNRAGVRGGGRD